MRVAAVLVFGIFGGILVELFGALGLAVATIVLAIGVLLRSSDVALVATVASAIALGLWSWGLSRCEPTVGRDCAPNAPELVLLGWAGLLIVVGTVVALRSRRRARNDARLP